MDVTQLIAFLRGEVTHAGNWQLFAEKLEHAEVQKGTLLLKPGQVANYLYLIESGALRFYVMDGDKETTFDFALEGSFTSGYSSFITQQPSQLYLQALTAVRLWRISYADLQLVYTTSPNGQYIGRLAAEGLFLRKAARELSLLTDTAEQRYVKLLTQNEALVQQIPLKYLASYIGITPQALSRIRARIS